jgi:hypothetical protein
MPGSSGAAVHFFDDSGRLLNSVAFSTGWRINLDSATLRKEPRVAGSVIEVRLGPERQVYGLLNKRVVLLRLEGSNGELIPNNYFAPNHTIGPDVPDLDAQEWEQALASGQKMVILEALVWLGGKHSPDLSEASLNRQWTSLVAEVRRRPGVRKAIEGLSRSDNPWMHEAARLALAQIER